MRFSLSLVIPIYNEEKSLTKTIRTACEALTKITADYELILVDDASTDDTADILERIKKDNPKIKVFRHEKNRKLGGALKTGFSKATKDLIIYSDADLPFDFHEIEKAIRVIDAVDADIIAAYRHDRTSDEWYRILYTLTYNLLIRVMYRIRVRDVNFAFKVFKRDIIQKMTIKSEGSFINAEILTRAHRMGYYICQIGVDYFVRSQGESTLASPGVIWTILKEAFLLFPELLCVKKKLK